MFDLSQSRPAQLGPCQECGRPVFTQDTRIWVCSDDCSVPPFSRTSSRLHSVHCRLVHAVCYDLHVAAVPAGGH
jgi:hypothetical protein